MSKLSSASLPDGYLDAISRRVLQQLKLGI